MSSTDRKIATTVVEPGFFRTELLVEGSSTIWPELSIDYYADRTTATIGAWRSMNGQQGGDRQARRCARDDHRTRDATAPLRRRSRRGRGGRTEGQRSARPDRRPPRPVHQPRPRNWPVTPVWDRRTTRQRSNHLRCHERRSSCQKVRSRSRTRIRVSSSSRTEDVRICPVKISNASIPCPRKRSKPLTRASFTSAARCISSVSIGE
jgi:hypothetical protein